MTTRELTLTRLLTLSLLLGVQDGRVLGHDGNQEEGEEGKEFGEHPVMI